MHSSRILLMNNGVRLESQSWGADHAPELDYTGSSMVEVVKGAECIRYGFGAMGGVVLLNDAPLPFGKEKIEVHGKANVGYDTNARGVSGSASLEAGYRRWGLRLHGMYTKGGELQHRRLYPQQHGLQYHQPLGSARLPRLTRDGDRLLQPLLPA